MASTLRADGTIRLSRAGRRGSIQDWAERTKELATVARAPVSLRAGSRRVLRVDPDLLDTVEMDPVPMSVLVAGGK